jgi:hypothetical protein
VHPPVLLGPFKIEESSPIGSIGDFPPGINRPRSESDHSPRSSTKVKNVGTIYFHSAIRLHNIHSFINGYTALCWALTVFSVSEYIHHCRTPWTGNQPVARPLPAHKTTQTRNKRTEASMPQVGFESMIPVLEREKTFDALDHSATVIDF